jgi:hypothetical protein
VIASPKRCSHSDVPLYILLVIRMTLTFRASDCDGSAGRGVEGGL